MSKAKIKIEVQLNDNEQFDEMIAERLIVLNVLRGRVQIDTIVASVTDFAHTIKMHMNDERSYYYLAQKRAEHRQAMN